TTCPPRNGPSSRSTWPSAPGASPTWTAIARPFSSSRPRFPPPRTRRLPATHRRSLSGPFSGPGPAPPDPSAANGAVPLLPLFKSLVSSRRSRHPGAFNAALGPLSISPPTGERLDRGGRHRRPATGTIIVAVPMVRDSPVTFRPGGHPNQGVGEVG